MAVAVVLAACSDDGEEAQPDPDRPAPTTTAVVDRSGIVLAPVAGETTTTVRDSGTARLVGTVRGPDGPVPGAVVRVDRILSDGQVRTDVVTGPDGAFRLEGVPGGRYRVRAFAPPALAQLQAEVRFLADGAEHSFDLVMEDHSGLVVEASAAPNPPLVDGPVNLVVQVAERRVDGDGVVRTQGLPSLGVELTGLGRWVLRGSAGALGGWSATSVTDSQGLARFELQCVAPGDPGLVAHFEVTVVPFQDPTTTTTIAPGQPPPGPIVDSHAVTLELPACVEPPPSTTAPPTTTRSTTTTTQRGTGGATGG